MSNHFPINNFSATLREAIDSQTQEIRLDVGCGSRLMSPCWVSIDDEIIDIGERQRAWISTGTDGVNRIFWGAMKDGVAGNGITIALVDPGAPDSAFSVSTIDNAISVSLATDSTGAITSTVEDVLKLVRRDLDASRLVQCYAQDEIVGGVVAAESVTLNGGDDDVLHAQGDPTGRGSQGTAAVPHAAGAKVEVRCTADMLMEIASSMNAIIVFPGQFSVNAGAPVLEELRVGGASGFTVKVWKFPQGEDAEVSIGSFVPDIYGGRAVGIIAIWYSKTPGAGSCHWRMRACAANSYVGSPAEQLPISFDAPSDNPGDDAMNIAAAFIELPGYAIGDGAVLASIGRVGSNADDTFAGDAYLFEAAILIA